MYTYIVKFNYDNREHLQRIESSASPEFVDIEVAKIAIDNHLTDYKLRKKSASPYDIEICDEKEIVLKKWNNLREKNSI